MLQCIVALMVTMAMLGSVGQPSGAVPPAGSTPAQPPAKSPAPSVSTPTGSMPAAGAGASTLSADPKKLVVQSSSREPQEISLLLHSSATTYVRWSFPQLVSPDGTRRLPRNAVSLAGDQTERIQIESNFPKDVVLAIALDGARSGEYAGDLIFYPGSSANPTVVPITIRLKDGVWWALVILALSLGASVVLSVYRTAGRKRDLLVLRMAPLQELLRDDADLQHFVEFHETLNTRIQDVGRQMKVGLAEAEAAANAAEAVARSWQDWRLRWVAANRSLNELLNHAAIGAASSEREAALAQRLAAPSAANPDALEAAIRTLENALNAAGVRSRRAGGVEMPKAGGGFFTRRQIARALFRKNSFEIASYVAAVLLLYFVGVKELYVSNPTFGADWFVDYFSLAVWGFGSEAARASVVSTIRSWGLQGVP